MILFWGKEEHEGSMQFQKYSERSIWGLSLGNMMLHFWIDLRPGFLGIRLLVKSVWYFINLLYGFLISIYSHQWTEKVFKMFQSLAPDIWSLHHSFRRDLLTLAYEKIPTFTFYILETGRKSSEFLKGRRVSWLHMGQ